MIIPTITLDRLVQVNLIIRTITLDRLVQVNENIPTITLDHLIQVNLIIPTITLDRLAVAAIRGVIGDIYPPPLESWGLIPLPRILGVITPEHIFRP